MAKSNKTLAVKPITFEDILSRDVPAIVQVAKNWARQGIQESIEVFYQHEAIAGESTAVSHDLTDGGWKRTGILIPSNVPYDKYWQYLYQRMGNVPLFA